MAKKIGNVDAEPGTSEAMPLAETGSEGGQAELQILMGEGQVRVAGQQLSVREYTFAEGLFIQATARSFLEDLYGVFKPGSTVPSFEQVSEICARNADVILDLMAKSANVERSWVESLAEAEGELLMLAWWRVNSGFYPSGPPARNRRGAPKQPVSWAKVFSALTQGGYGSCQQLKSMTGRQLQLLYRESQLQRRRFRAELINDMNAAVNGAPKETAALLRHLLSEE